ncbi:cyclin-dependent kinase 6-like [Varroa jacobsoni]|uniref:cyclin-dependent kinase n=1 Tax=Varroa destructor TaxID=109461 RepID=A0A7M7KFU0_VARDE|nr:cyclin-dependent kinase 6-like [Varroa destructor]XP_022666175.1 cyclin-dependent kinase 6-like [Varroa destructor]XP_022666176.1 cyclin-dependent kinase 6-like [Varroa destructor]XP_022695599.1 cyclin-dependent kinase 6-like [Varroa jacobsoni]XP_022695600.1 cyclin-dependent kinase 6-like [Varroa jacobsoni]XP_022695601.1 cyclin-dependent kinase 6-like [Varroa jacobsoni]
MNGLKNYDDFNHIGTGAFGTVFKARDKKNEGRFVALKKVRMAITDDGVPLSVLREIALLKQLEAFSHKNIVQLYDICHGRRGNNDLVIFLVLEHVDQDLATFLEKCPPPGLESSLIKSLSHQMLTGIEFLHANRIVHRDLKPQNILVTDRYVVKLADFGLARIYEYQMALTPVVVTLWYRPPEVLLQSVYASPVDLWSCGCIIAELFTRKPLFPGSSEGSQLGKILEIIGTPSRESWPQDVCMAWEHFSNFGKGEDLANLIPEAEPAAINLIRALVEFDYRKRLTAEAALRHPFFDGFEPEKD